MATITKRAFLRHLQAGPTTYVQRMKRGEVAAGGTGVSFWFRPLNTALSELPIDEQELPLLFRARTADFQEVSVQATITYRIAEPRVASTRVDFSIDVDTGAWSGAPLEQLGVVLIEQAQQHAVGLLAQRELGRVMATGIVELRQEIGDGLRSDTRLSEIGIEIVGVRVIAVRPESDVEKALQTPVREQLQQQAAEATYERRAVAVEQERAIAENELANQIELARREENLVRQQGQNEQRRVTDESEAKRIKNEAAARDIEVRARADAERLRLTGAAKADAELARVSAYDDTRDEVLFALAVRDFAGQLPNIESLVLTPDLLTPILAKLGSGARGTADVAALNPAGNEDAGGRNDGGRQR